MSENSGLTDHYVRIAPIAQALGVLDSDGRAIGNADFVGWYRTREVDLPYELLSEDCDGIGRGWLLDADYRRLRSVVDRTLYATTSYAARDAFSWRAYTHGDDGRNWEDRENPLPRYGDLVAYAPFADIDLDDEVKHQRPTGEIPRDAVEAALTRYIDAFADLAGSRNAVYALDSVGGAYVFIAPSATAPIANEFDRDDCAGIFDELTDRINDWLDDVRANVNASVADAAGMFEADLVNNKNRLYKAPLSVHSSLDGVVTPIDPDAPTYEFTSIKAVNEELITESVS